MVSHELVFILAGRRAWVRVMLSYSALKSVCVRVWVRDLATHSLEPTSLTNALCRP